MEKEFKEIISETKKSLKKIEKNIEERSEDLTEDVKDFWKDLKKHLSSLEEKLDDAYDDFGDQVKDKAHLGMIEARERIKNLEEVAHEFTAKVSSNAQEELDVMALRAHLLKMESEDYWEEKQKELSKMYDNSKEEAEKLAMKAAKEINQIFLKLTEIV